MSHRALGPQFEEQMSLLGDEYGNPSPPAGGVATSVGQTSTSKPPEVPGQLAMFMTPREILAKYRPSPFESDMYGGDKALWKFKYQEAKDSGLVESLKNEQVHTPIQVSVPSAGEKPEVLEGHHRVVAALAADPGKKLLPVVHYDVENERELEQQMIDHERWNS